MSRKIIGPFNRVEGDLEVRLEITEGQVQEAHVVSPLYRGFEKMLEGRPPLDALTIAPRICGICSISQSMAAAQALRKAAGGEAAPNGVLAAHILHAVENLADHITHFHLFFMPDFTRPAYEGRAWFQSATADFTPNTGQAAKTMISARARLLHAIGVLAGKWPHTLAIQPGGSTQPVGLGEKSRLLSLIASFKRFLETEFFGGACEAFADLQTREQLLAWDGGSAGLLIRIAQDLDLFTLGRTDAPLLSYGSFEGAFKAGLLSDGAISAPDYSAITEDLTASWMDGETRPPFEGLTEPVAEKDGAYSWCKAPRLDGLPAQTGALARQAVDRHPLALALVQEFGATVMTRMVGRLIEIARLPAMMEGWAKALVPREPFCADLALPKEAQAAGLVEAARGALGHWITIERGVIKRYQIIAPTTWNFSPRDGQGQPGPLEQALVGASAAEDEDTPVSVQHIVRSFDPCMVCTVH